MKRLIPCILVLVFVFLIAGVVPNTAMPAAPDGWALLDHGDTQGAQKQFEADRSHSPGKSTPLLGLAMVDAELGHYTEGEQHLAAAAGLAKTNEARLEYHAIAIRYYVRAQTPKNWLEKSKKHFDDGARISNSYSPLQYQMSHAYIAADNLSRAQDLLAQVVAMKGQYAAEADREWNKVQKILRASPATHTGAGIAMQDRISRADLCALLAGELSTHKAFAERKTAAVTAPGDIAMNSHRDAILEVLRWHIRGLEVRPGGKFAPNDPVRRGEFAFVLEDVLIKTSGDSTLATRFIGTEKSPFSDVPPTYPWFNSVMTVTSRNLLEAGTDGKFKPEENVDGADTLLAIRKLAGH